MTKREEHQVHQNLVNFFSKEMPAEKAESTTAELLKSKKLATGKGSAISYLFYMIVKVSISEDDGKTSYDFKGKGGGLTVPGGQVFAGDLYSNNNSTLDDILSKTRKYQYVTTAIYTVVSFKDEGGDVLGYLHCFSGGTATGSNDGKGRFAGY